MSTRAWLVCAVLCLLACEIQGARRTSRVVYGSDDRRDFFEVNVDDQRLGAGVALLLEGEDLFEQSGTTLTARGASTLEDAFNICPSDRYASQLVIDSDSSCSGFLISANPPWIGTAAHCESSTYVVFDFDQLADGPRLSFDQNQVYRVNRVVGSGGNPNGGEDDYAILELDRPVVGREVFMDIAPQVSLGESVHLVGHPTGLPKKFDRGGVITEVNPKLYYATVDSFGGNSGSPVFDTEGRILGILVGGTTDYVAQGDCEVTNFCPGGDGCDSASGEALVPICDLVNGIGEVPVVLGWTCDGNPSRSATRTPTPSVASTSTATRTPSPQASRPAATPSSTRVAVPNSPSRTGTPVAVPNSPSRTPAGQNPVPVPNPAPAISSTPSSTPVRYIFDDDDSSSDAHVVAISVSLFVLAVVALL